MSYKLKLSRSGSADQFLDSVEALFTSTGKPLDAFINSSFINTSGYIISGTTITQLDNIPLNGNNYCTLGTNVIYDGANYSITVSGVIKGSFSLIGGTVTNIKFYSNNATLETEAGVVCKKLAYGVVTGCTVDMPSTFMWNDCGGIVGSFAGFNGTSITISNCTVKCTVGNNAGGICGSSCGRQGSIIISNCYCEITSGNNNWSGIAGTNVGCFSGSCTISDCTVKLINTTGANSYGSGICGRYGASDGGNLNITNCSFIGTTSGMQIYGDYQSGICGDYAATRGGSCSIINCNSICLYKDRNASGICGQGAGSTSGYCLISNCYSIGEMYGSSSTGICGDYAGQNNGRCEIKNCYSSVSFYGNSCSGICGYSVADNRGYCLISECYSTGTINGQRSSYICGSHAGTNNGLCEIIKSYSINPISGIFSSGICGENAGYRGKCVISECYATGNLQSSNATGICNNNAGKEGICIIEKSYFTGYHKAPSTFGICGSNAGYTGYCIIRNCYNTGSIVSDSCAGICGTYAGSTSGYCLISQCYWKPSYEGRTYNDRSLKNSSCGICSIYAGATNGFCEIIDCNVEGTTMMYWATGICGEYAGNNNGKCRIIRCSSKFDKNIDNKNAGITRKCGNTGYCLIKDCYSYLNIECDSAGGICTDNIANSSGYVIIQNCRTEGYIKNSNYSGGIVGGERPGMYGRLEIFNCSSSMHMIDDNKWCGGIVGGENPSNNITISNCYYTGNMYLMSYDYNPVKQENAGILGGSLSDYGPTSYITNCYALGDSAVAPSGFLISTSGINFKYNGGIVSIYYSGYISNCFYLGNIIGSFCGGICAGYLAQQDDITIIENCYTVGNIIGECGGIVGPYIADGARAIIRNCYSTGNVSDNCGSIIGRNSNSRLCIFNCYGNGPITPSGSSFNYFANIKADGSLDPDNIYYYKHDLIGFNNIPVLSLTNITNKLIISDQMNKVISVSGYAIEVKNWADAWTTPSSNPSDNDIYPRLKQFFIKPWSQSSSIYYNTTTYTAYNKPPTLDYYLYDDTKISVTLSGSIIDTGMINPYERGFTYGLYPNPQGSVTFRTREIGSFGISNFTHTLEGLYPNTTYNIRSYATNTYGSGYGTEITITTSNYFPVINLLSFQYINQRVGVCRASINATGGSPITDFGYVWSKLPDPTIDLPDIYELHITNPSGYSLGEIITTVSGLNIDNEMYIRAFAQNSTGIGYSSTVFVNKYTSFIPVVSTIPVSTIADVFAVTGVNLISKGGIPVTRVGVVWSTSNTSPTVTLTTKSEISGFHNTGLIPITVSGLVVNTTYYIRAYASNANGTEYGNTIQFKTLQVTPFITVAPITEILQYSARVTFTITDLGGSPINTRGVVWSKLPNPIRNDLDSFKIEETGTFSTGTNSYVISLLDHNTVYYVRAYAINSTGITYGTQQVFTTLKNSVPTTSILSLSYITTSSVIATGSIIRVGVYNTLFERGIIWGLTSDVNIQTSIGIYKQILPFPTDLFDSFFYNISDLTPATTYYIRSYAINSYGIGYSESSSFSTLALGPDITSDSIISSNGNSVTVSGTIVSTGGSNVTSVGVLWSILPSPTIDLDTKTTVSGSYSAGTFTVTAYGLTPNTTYYVRTFATNEIGTAYGSDLTVTTGLSPGIVTSYYSITTSGFGTFKGTLTNIGGSAVTSRGIVWNTSSNPTIDSKLGILTETSESGFSVGAFTLSTSGFDTNTIYYIRAYAINSAGVSYGDNIKTVADLYPFVSHSFTTAGATGRFGPTLSQIKSAYSFQPWASSTSYLNMSSQGIQLWTVPTTGIYRITAAGSGGGSARTCAGRGVIINSTFSFTKGTVLKILVGQKGGIGIDNNNVPLSSGGGGGSFVTLNDNTPILIAGGGAGFAFDRFVNCTLSTNILSISDATISTTANNSSNNNGIGGSNGNGGTGASSDGWAGGGGGLLTDGTPGSSASGAFNNAMKGYAFVIGGEGGAGPSPATFGGFGGGGATGDLGVFGRGGGGGGGGYSGGGGSSTILNTNVGGGGGSYSSSTLTFVDYNTAAGYVSIQLESPTLTNILSVTITSTSSVTYSSATVNGIISSKGYYNILGRGLVWSATNKFPTISVDSYTSETGTFSEGTFSANMTNLLPSTTYYARMYVRDYYNNNYSDVIIITTPAGLPVLSTDSVTNIQARYVTLNGTVRSEGGTGQDIIERGFVYSSITNPPTVSDTKVIVSGTSIGSFSTTISGLVIGTTYYVRAYAINSSGIGYSSNTITFITKSMVDNNVTTINIQYNTRDSFIATGAITSSGTSPILTRGFVYSTSINPTIATPNAIIINETSPSGFSVESYTLRCTYSLPTFGTYYIRSYIIDSNNLERYGGQISFVRIPNKPTIVTPNPVASLITGVSAKLSITISNTGGSNVSQLGFVWNTLPDPTIETSPFIVSSGNTASGTYAIDVSGFMHNTTYYVRAYGRNLAGISYGDNVTFTTTSESPPTIITAGYTPLQNLNTSGLTVSGFSVVTGNILSTGGTVIRRGVVWATTSQPTVSSNLGIVEVPFPGGTTDYTGEFNCTIAPLDTTTVFAGYYIRTFAESAAGIGYGNEEYISSGYYFRTHTFTSCGATGSSGPNIWAARAAYSSIGASWVNSTNNFKIDRQGYQIWIPPQTGIYIITAAGAGGGGASMLGGRGRILTSALYLSRVSEYAIVVGQPGISNGSLSSGGGGGSFVSISYNTPLLIAGGGGGFTRNANLSGPYPTSDANLLTLGFDSFDGLGKGGMDGNGGGAAGIEPDIINGGSGGGGYYGNGSRSYKSINYSIDNRGKAFVDNGLGGISELSRSNGGFGGGGGALSRDNAADGGGGGGGYSGGAGSGASTNNNPAGGGGSYSISLVTSSGYNIYQNTSGVYITNGYVTVQPANTGINVQRSIIIKSINSSSGTYTITANVGGLAGQYGYQRGFVYSTTNTAPTLQNDSCIETGFFGSGYFTTTTPVNLMPGTKYYIRAFMITTNVTSYNGDFRGTSAGKVTATVYSTSLEYTTPNGVPTVSTDPQPLKITMNSCELTANLLATGGSIVTERGFIWATTNNNLTIENYTWLYRETSESGFDLGNFTAAITSVGSGEETYPTMNPNTTYYIRAFVANSSGYSYSPIISFKTESIVTPTIINYNLSYKSDTSAIAGFIVTDTGGSEIFERGIVYSLTNTNPIVE